MIALDHVHKVSNGTTLLQIEHLTVGDGEIAAVVGSPGSGLDTLRDLLVGRIQPTSGSIRIADAAPTDHQSFSRAVGVLFHDNALYRRRSAQQHLAFECSLRGLDRAQVAVIMDEVGLSDHARQPAEKLSPSLQRRLAFGRAIVHNPPVLLLMDPFEGCDNTTVDLLTRRIRERAAGGAGSLVLARDTQHLRRLCSVLYLLEHGEITEIQEPAAEAAAALPFKIPVKREDEIMLVNPGDILFATAREGRCWLRLADRDLPTQFTLGELEDRLIHRGFFRAHRSYLVNLQHVNSVIPYTRSTYTLVLDDQESTQIPLSRNAAAELRDLLGY